jgi:Mg-chelatase subunit ChlD
VKRLIYDIPRWHLLLHREHRDLPLARPGDEPRLRLEDELFERLHAGELDRLPTDEENPALRAWAERFHATCEALPVFGRLAAECRGDAAAAAAATETVLRLVNLPPMDAPSPAAVPGSSGDPLRRPLAAACGAASRAVDELREATEGLASIAFGNTPGTGGVPGSPQDGTPVRSLAVRLRRDPRLLRIALLAGRFKRIAAAKRRQRVKHGADEITDIEQGADLARALPAELAKLAHPRRRLDFMRSFLERRVLQYQLSGTDTLGRGPLVLLLDKSGSMGGQKDIWATALALAILERAHAEQRPFALVDFSGRVTYEAMVEPGRELPHQALFVSCGGGTSIAAAFERALEIIAHHPRALRRSDIVLITDGGSDPERAPELLERARALGVTSLGLAIEVAAETLGPWCDEAHGVSSLSTLEENIAGPLFSG